MRRFLATIPTIALGLAIAGYADGANACATTVGVNADGVEFTITTDTTWGGVANPSPICLEEPIFVTGGATLTILPGTIVRGQPRRGPVGFLVDTPGTLVITQDGAINAEGSATSPIVMTTAAVDNDADGICDDLDADTFKDPYPGFDPSALPSLVPDATPTFCDSTPTTAPLAPLDLGGASNVQLWGGLVLLGQAPTNVADMSGAPGGYGFGNVEGLILPGTTPEFAQCGGSEAHDNSGILRYVSVRHAGDEIDVANELNGITVCAVGDGTIMEFIEVYANFDDGFEWFGGTVNANHLVVTYVGDDSLDMDWGYTGAIQFVLTIMSYFNEDSGSAFGSASGDRMGELDGDDFLERGGDVNTRDNDGLGATDNTPWPLSNPYIFNWTGIGSTPDGANPATSAAADNRGIFMRHGFAGQVLNSVVVNTGSRACLELDTDTGESTTGHDVIDNVGADLIRMVSSSCDGGAALAAAAVTASSNGDAYALTHTGMACSANEFASFTGLAQEDPDFDPKGDPADGKLRSSILGGTGAYDPRLTGTVGIDCGVQPQDTGLDRAATYRGAFPTTAPELWTTGWTVLNIAGLLAN